MNSNSCIFAYIGKQFMRVRARLFLSYPTLCDSIHCSLRGSSVQEIFQAGILEWVAMPSSMGDSLLRD